jgi:hypothetical protein
MSWFSEKVVTPILSIVLDANQNGVEVGKEKIKMNVNSFIGNSEMFRNLCKSQYKSYKQIDGVSLENLPQEQKLNLWNESLTYCPEDRIGWCEAVRFFEIATELQK